MYSILDVLMIVITGIGSTSVLVTGTIIVIAVIWSRSKEKALVFALTMSSSPLINHLLKNYYQVARPTGNQIIVETDYSFPSGHAMNSLVFYSLLAYYIYQLVDNKIYGRIAMAFSVTLILLIGFSRVYLGVHYPSDVLAGWFFGLLWLLVALTINRVIRSKFIR